MGFAQFDMGHWGGVGTFMLSGVGVVFFVREYIVFRNAKYQGRGLHGQGRKPPQPTTNTAVTWYFTVSE